MNNDTVSIALATYNSERFLRKQLDSIYNQSYKNIEVIACDDQSTDGTVEILDEYKKMRGLQYYINNSNIGYLRNFEKTLGLCNGSYIALSDHDDIWLPNKIERLMNCIGNYSLICSDAYYIDENDNIFASSIKEFTGQVVFSGKPYKYLAFRNFVTGCTALFKKELLKNALPIPESEKNHDWWLALSACTMNGILYLEEPLIMYRRHNSNAIGFSPKASRMRKLFGFLIEGPDLKNYIFQENRLKMLSGVKIFSYEERKFFQLAYEYFHDRLNTKIHKKAFAIALRNFRYIFPDVFGFYRFKSLLAVLLR
jgi:glycosyltransferase involved in cell wall biosynthesis